VIEGPGLRPDGWEKVTGAARFVADLPIPGVWLGGTVRSPVARGRIRKIRLDPAFDWSSVTVVTARDLPGPNVVAMIKEDHPILAAEEVRFVGEAVALVAAPDEETLRSALAAIVVEIDELSPVLTIEDSLSGREIIWGQDNIIAEYRIEDGDPAAGFAQADRIVEGIYRTGHQEHLYLEPNGVVALPHGSEGIEVVGSLQCPYYVHRALALGLAIDSERVRVRQAVTGGAFGGKEDYPSVLALHAAALARRCGKAVRMIYGRSEDIRCTTKRHPSLVRHRTGVNLDGTLVAAEIDVLLDAGAYTTLSPVVLSRAVLHATNAYRVPNVVIRGRAVATNTPPNGAFRGFGAPQTIFAMERQMDRIARELSLDPLTIRRRNVLREGDRLPCGQLLQGEVGASLVLERAAELAGYEMNRSGGAARAGRGDRAGDGERGSGPASETNAASPIRRGLGLSLFLHGGGFTGSGEEKIAGRAAVEYVLPEGEMRGHFDILVSNVEMGQGASTVLGLMAAQTLGVPPDAVRHPLPDTARVPDSGPTVASRTTMVVGRIVIDACLDLLDTLKTAVCRWSSISPIVMECVDGVFRADGRSLGSVIEVADRYVRESGSLRGCATYTPTAGLQWDEQSYRGSAYKAYSYGADVVEVEVNTDTMEVRPVRTTVVVEIGKAVHPVLAAGQIEGGTLQALGYGSMEEMQTRAGHFLNDRLATYIIPTALDAPDFEVEIAELVDPRDWTGPKGLGELPFDGGAPALAAAIEDATGIFAAELPITPEKLMRRDEERR
jgi:CO/xanthine dehydrogenase Mo-binding subunit